MLKKILLILVVAVSLLYLCPLSQTAFSLTTPHIVIETEVWLLDIESGKRIFLLPVTYYAKIDNMDDNFYYVTFNSIKGKIEKNIVATVGYHTQASGTMQELKVHSQYSDFVTIALRSSMDSTADNIVVPVNESFIFLGEFPLTEMWYCVKYDDKIGYIKATRTTIPEIEIPAFIPETKEHEKPLALEQQKKDKSFLKNPDTLRVVIIVGLSIPAIALIILLFKPQKPKRQRYYYEE